jgi:hypothetical protein
VIVPNSGFIMNPVVGGGGVNPTPNTGGFMVFPSSGFSTGFTGFNAGFSCYGGSPGGFSGFNNAGCSCFGGSGGNGNPTPNQGVDPGSFRGSSRFSVGSLNIDDIRTGFELLKDVLEFFRGGSGTGGNGSSDSSVQSRLKSIDDRLTRIEDALKRLKVLKTQGDGGIDPGKETLATVATVHLVGFGVGKPEGASLTPEEIERARRQRREALDAIVKQLPHRQPRRR